MISTKSRVIHAIMPGFTLHVLFAAVLLHDIAPSFNDTIVIAGHNQTMQFFHCVAYAVEAPGYMVEPSEFCGVYALFAIHNSRQS